MLTGVLTTDSQQRVWRWSVGGQLDLEDVGDTFTFDVWRCKLEVLELDHDLQDVLVLLLQLNLAKSGFPGWLRIVWIGEESVVLEALLAAGQSHDAANSEAAHAGSVRDSFALLTLDVVLAGSVLVVVGANAIGPTVEGASRRHGQAGVAAYSLQRTRSEQAGLLIGLQLHLRLTMSVGVFNRLVLLDDGWKILRSHIGRSLLDLSLDLAAELVCSRSNVLDCGYEVSAKTASSAASLILGLHGGIMLLMLLLLLA